jgi:RluA family pseudouridine synthase
MKRKIDQARDEDAQPVEFEVKNGLRYVKPYYRTLRSFVKERWLGKRILDVCEAEFRAFERSHYERALEEGDLRVVSRKGEERTRECALQNNDELVHRMLFVESPVPASPGVRVIFEDARVLAVDKPAGWPVHPCGGFGENSVTMELKRVRPDLSLHLVHRIDRVTSGLLLFAKDPVSACAIGKLLTAKAEGGVEKVYFARVKGRFEGERRVECYLRCVDVRIGAYAVCAQGEGGGGKFSASVIRSVVAGEEESIVECHLETGRTHQARLHLNHIGHPIVNDECYGGLFDKQHPFAFARCENKNGDADAKTTGIFLHAHRYKIPGFVDIQTSDHPPPWATSLAPPS